MAVNDHEPVPSGNVFIPAPPQIVVEDDPDAADDAAAETLLGPGDSATGQPGRRIYPRKIWHFMAVIAVAAVACSWPEPFVLVGVMVLGGMVTLKAILSKRGPQVAEWGVVLVIVGALIALLQPAAVTGPRTPRWTVSSKRLNRPFPPRSPLSPNPVLSRGAPAAQLGP